MGVIHAVLLGDSSFDNRAYVGDGLPVIEHLREILPTGACATLLAVDGDMTREVRDQISRVPTDATHLVLSVGGNDALSKIAILESPAKSVAEALLKLAAVRDSFERAYRSMLDEVLALGLPVVVCTVYNPRFLDPTRQTVATLALATLNDAIVRVALGAGVSLIDLRLVTHEYSDYANDIEPSSEGGRKIAKAIAATLEKHDFSAINSTIYQSVAVEHA